MRIDDDLYALALQLGHALEARRQMAATAESCTGGLVAGAITAVAGSSAWFDRGFITYSNEAKIEQLGVSRETLATFGAVSTQTAAEMADGRAAGKPGAVDPCGHRGCRSGRWNHRQTGRPGMFRLGRARGRELGAKVAARRPRGYPAGLRPDRFAGPDRPSGLVQSGGCIERSFYAIMDSSPTPTLQAHHEQRTRQEQWNECNGR